MSIIAGIAAGAAATGALAQVGSSIGGILADAQNYKNQQENIDYQKWAQRNTWAREDTAYQRAAADLQAAGLSKTLAAGSASPTSTPVRTDAPQMSTSNIARAGDSVARSLDAASAALALMRQKADITKTEEETKLITQQQTRGLMDMQNLQQSITFDQAANPLRLKAMALANQGQDTENLNKTLDSQLKQYGISQAAVDLVNSKIDTQSKQIGLSLARQEQLAKEIAIDLAKSQVDTNNYNLQWYQKLGLPTNSGLDPAIRTGTIVGNALNKLSGQLYDNQRR